MTLDDEEDPRLIEMMLEYMYTGGTASFEAEKPGLTSLEILLVQYEQERLPTLVDLYRLVDIFGVQALSQHCLVHFSDQANNNILEPEENDSQARDNL